MDDENAAHQPSEAEAVDEAVPVAPAAEGSAAPSAAAPGTQQVVIETNADGDGSGAVGLYRTNVGAVSVDGDGKGLVTLEDGDPGITVVSIAGARPNATVTLTVEPS